MNSEPLDRPADRATLDRLLDAGLLTPEAREEAVRWVEPRQDWWTWSGRSLLFTGSTLVLAGIVFFFAYNWAKMGPFLKLGLAEGAVIACLVGVLRMGLDRLGGKVFLFATSFLAGVFLAVFGQVYQTGADNWELFAGWAALILAWVVVSRFAALWILWLTVVNVAVILHHEQMSPGDVPSTMFLTLAAVDLVALFALEIGSARGIDWIQKAWTRPLLWGAALFYLTIPVLTLICDRYSHTPASIIAVPALLASYGAAIYYFRRAPDLRALTLAALSLCTVIVTGIGRLVFEATHESVAFLIVGLAALSVFSGAVMGLRALARRMKGEAHA
jgi:uncharacterized membrane protein